MATPTIGTLSVNADLTVDIPIDDMGGHTYVRVDYAVPPGGYQPVADSHLWRALETIETPGVVVTPAQVYGSTVWVRASGRTSAGERIGDYATDSIVIADVPRLDATAITLTDGVAPVVSWTPASTAGGVRLSWVVHPAGQDPGSWTDSVDLDAADETYSVPVSLDVGEAITVLVEAWETFDGVHEVVGGEQGLAYTLTVARAIVPLAPLVVRSITADTYTLTALDAGIYLRCSDPTGFTLTVPEDATLTLPTGTTVWVEQEDTGTVTVAPETSAPVLQSLGNQLSTAGQYAVLRLVKVAADTWTVHGDIAS